MIVKALRIIEVQSIEELQGEGWFQLFGEGIPSTMYGRWEELQEPTEDIVQVDVAEAGDIYEPQELQETSEVHEIGYWDHPCEVMGEVVRTTKGFPCDFCKRTAGT